MTYPTRRNPPRLRSGLWLMLGALLAAAFALSSAEPAHAVPPLAACENHVDDDGDGATDFPAEPGCSNRNDGNEANPTPLPQCSDNVDTDLDAKEYPLDPGCRSAADATEADPATLPECSDTLDNDTDAKFDYPADFGCIAASDNSEADTACSDGADNDADGKADYPSRTALPFDPGCNAPSGQANPNNPNSPNAAIPDQNDPSEDDPPECNDGIDNDGDGWIDADAGPLKDPGCTARADTTEAPNPQCSDGIDNDGDGKIDLGGAAGRPPDPGCTTREDDNELDSAPSPPPACSDGIDNDGDGKIDHPADTGCTSRTDTDEADPGTATAGPAPAGSTGSGAGQPVTGPPGVRRFPPISPFPVVRLRGKADSRGVTITLLRIQAPNGSKVTIYCNGKACPLRKKVQVTRTGFVRVRRFEGRRLRAGTSLTIYVTRSGFTGKYTRFRIRSKNRSPARFDGCARFAGKKPVTCPAN